MIPRLAVAVLFFCHGFQGFIFAAPEPSSYYCKNPALMTFVAGGHRAGLDVTGERGELR